MTNHRALGWLADPPAASSSYQSGHRMLARARAADLLPLDRASLFRFRGAPLEQGPIGSCFAFGCTRAFQLYRAAHSPESSVEAAVAASDAEIASPRWLYYAARAGEFAGDNVDSMPPLEDTGSYPYLGFEQIRQLGFVPWSSCPYPKGAELDDPEQAREVIAKQPSPNVVLDAFDTRGLETARVAGAGLERVRQVAALLKQRCPVGFGMQVDNDFLRNTGGVIQDVNRFFVQGGHWMQVLAVVPSITVAAPKTLEELRASVESNAAATPDEVTSTWEVIVDNWWGPHWGRFGIGRISAGLFGSSWISDVTAVRFLPEQTR